MMKSVQELRVDSNKQQLLESRLKPISSYNMLSTSDNSGETNGNAINSALDLSLIDGCKNEENSSSSACCLTNNSIINVIAESSSNTPVNNNNVNKSVSDLNNDAHALQRQMSNSKRKRRQKVDSPHSKKICSRSDKRIDEIFKTLQSVMAAGPLLSSRLSQAPQTQPQQPQLGQSPSRNSATDNSSVDSWTDAAASTTLTATSTAVATSTTTMTTNVISANAAPATSTGVNNGSTNNLHQPLQTQTSSSVVASQSASQAAGSTTKDQESGAIAELRRRLEEIEREAEERQREVDRLKETVKAAREAAVRALVAASEAERQQQRERAVRDSVQLGCFKAVRQGALVEDKWVPGQLYAQLDTRREALETERELYERDKKQFNRTKKAGPQQQQPQQHWLLEQQQQADILDSRKNGLNKREKELQETADRLDRDRLLHIRETKRLHNEDASRFRKFPVLHERYLMLSLLGKGGFSEVFKAFDLDKFCFVACKVHELNANWPQEKKDSYIRHALREIEIHKKLEHPRIVRVLDVFNIDSDAFCTVMEFCEGSDLDFFLKQSRSVPEKEARCIVSQVVSALRYLNERRNPVIHYDLKPGNILLCRRDCQIKITDFGLSKIFPDDRRDSEEGMELTSQGAGTYWYLPPECFVTDNGPPTISSKVDVWSVGVIFYQCLYGKKPFGDNETQTDILHNNTILQARSINFPSNPKVSDVAKDFIRKCCTYRKELRPDVFQLYNDDYLKSKTQLKYGVEVSSLPGPSPSNNSLNNNLA